MCKRTKKDGSLHEHIRWDNVKKEFYFAPDDEDEVFRPDAQRKFPPGPQETGGGSMNEHTKEHTQEPWQVNDQTASGVMNNSVYICDEAGRIIARVFNDYGNHIENARRIVACVNACAGVSTQFLESIGESGLDNPADAWIRGSQQIRAVEQQRDKLLAALNELLSFNLETDGATCEWPELVAAVINARAAIAQIEAANA